MPFGAVLCYKNDSPPTGDEGAKAAKSTSHSARWISYYKLYCKS